jgi:hypothetical protein
VRTENEYSWLGTSQAATGVGVVAPGATHLGALVDDDEVGLAVLLEPDRSTQSGEAGAHDEVLDLLRCFGRWSRPERYWRY